MVVDMVVVWVGIGAVTGLLASLLLSRVPAGIMGSIVIGIIGAAAAGVILSLLNLPLTPGILLNAGVAFVGSVLLLAAAQTLV